MKILIITPIIGRTAPGIVFEKLIFGLAKYHTLNILTADYSPSMDLSSVASIIVCEKRNLHQRVFKLFISLFGVNPIDLLWARNAISKIKNNDDYDLIFSFVSFHHYCALIAGFLFSRRYKTKFAVYSVDAIPAPKGWAENRGYYKGVLRLVKKYLSNADAFFSSNKQMLDYQLQKFSNKVDLVTNVIFTPGSNNYIELSKPNEVFKFVYTGGIYGVRKADYVIGAFEKLLVEYPFARLIFVGTKLPLKLMNGLKPSTIQQIEMLPFTSNLNQFYEDATALIDIDAEIENDVFLSSKISNYLMVNRIIISQTGVNSPSRHLFKNVQSIFQCNHVVEEIFLAMEKSIKMRDSINFDDRKELVEMFKIENVVKTLNFSLFALKKI